MPQYKERRSYININCVQWTYIIVIIVQGVLYWAFIRVAFICTRVCGPRRRELLMLLYRSWWICDGHVFSQISLLKSCEYWRRTYIYLTYSIVLISIVFISRVYPPNGDEYNILPSPHSFKLSTYLMKRKFNIDLLRVGNQVINKIL